MFLDQRQGVCKLEEKNTSFEWNIQGLLKIKQFEIEEKEPKTSETDTKEIGDTVTYTIYWCIEACMLESLIFNTVT